MIIFAHRGAPQTRHEDNTLAAFERALALGADGLESDIALTADSIPVLAHPRPWHRDPPIARLRYADLPGHIPSLDDLYSRCGTAFDLSLDMGQPEAVEAVLAVAERHHAVARLWLTYWRLPTLSSWRRRWPDLHLVYATMPLGRGRLPHTLADLAEQRIDSINILHWFYTPRLIEHIHTHGLGAFAWGVRRHWYLERLQRRGIDAVFLDMQGPVYDGTRQDAREGEVGAQDHP